jgi:hypothetical protein
MHKPLRAIPTTRTAQRSLEAFNQWVKLNNANSVKQLFDTLPLPYQRRFLWLVRAYSPNNAMALTVRLKKIVEKASANGYTFTTPMGMLCTVKRLDKEPEYAEKYLAMSQHRDMLRYDCAMSVEYLKKTAWTGSYIFTFKAGGSTFGLIYWLTVLQIPSRRLLTIIDCVKNGVTPGTASLAATFNDGEMYLINHQPQTRRAALIILAAIRHEIPPSICTLLHENKS